MESIKIINNNAVTLSQLFDNVLEYISCNNNINNTDDDDLQSMEEMIYNILLYVESNGGGAEELVAVEEIVYNALLVVMTIRDRIGVAPAPEIRNIAVLVNQATETCDVPEPALETTDQSVMVIDGEDLQDHQPTAVEDVPAACDPDGGKNDDEDLPAEVETGTLMVEDLAAVEPDRPYVAPIETSKPRRGRFASAWKSTKRAALRLCCVR